MTGRRLYFVSAEPSGDQFSARVMKRCLEIEPGISLVSSSATGATDRFSDRSDINLSGLSILGWSESVRALSRVKRLANAVADDVIDKAPDGVVLVDSWGFTYRVASILKKRFPELPLFKLVGPQIWASRPGRARTVARLYDEVFTILPQENALYAGLDTRATLIGPPILDGFEGGSGERFREAYNLPPNQQICLICPGSRPAEARRVALDLLEAGRRLRAKYPELLCVVAPSSTISPLLSRLRAADDRELWVSGEEHLRDAAAAASIALACSGSVTLELAASHVPTVVGYRVSPLTYRLAKAGFMTTPFMSLVNVAAGMEVMPELLQTQLRSQSLVALSSGWLDDERSAEEQASRQSNALTQLVQNERPASDIAARAILASI